MYVYLWEFNVKKEKESTFEEVYGTQGIWVQLFRKGNGYLRTELHRDITDSNRYITIDYWISQEACDTFRKEWENEFNTLDKQCESLTEKETFLGSFSTIE